MLEGLKNKLPNFPGDRHFARNYFLNTTDGAFYALAMGMVPLNTVLTYFVSGYVSQKWLIGLFSCLNVLLTFCPQILVSKKLERVRRIKPLMLVFAVVLRILWLLMGLNVILLADKNPVLFIILFYILYSLIGLASAFTGITWLNFIVKIIPESFRGRFFGIRSTISGMFEMLGALLMGILLKTLPSPLNYGILFLTVFALTVISLMFLSFSKEEDRIREENKDRNEGYLIRMRRVLREDKNFTNYLFSVLFIGALGKMPFAFQIIFAKERLGITTLEVSYATFLLLAFQTIGYLIWGIIGDKKGFKLTLVISAAVFLPTLILTFMMSNRLIFYISIALFGIAQSARNVNENNLAINLCRNFDDQPLYIGLRNFLMGPAFALYPLLAGLLLDSLGLLPLFIVSAIFMTVGLYVLARTVKEYR